MSRVLVAGVSSPAPASPGRGFVSSGDPRHAAFEAELREHNAAWSPEADVWSLIADLWLLGRKRLDLEARLARLNAQLDDPALASHPRRPAAEARYSSWRGELGIIEDRADRLKLALARAWHRVPERRRAELRTKPGWGTSLDGKALAAELWASAKRGGPWPGGEPPF